MQNENPKSLKREISGTCIYALILALLLRTLIIQAFWIPSGSMHPTLKENDRVLVLKFWYLLPKVEPKRGEIVVFKYPRTYEANFIKRQKGSFVTIAKRLFPGLDEKSLKKFVGFSEDEIPAENKDYVKRLIGLPGEIVDIKDGKVFINNQALNEPYLDGLNIDNTQDQELKVLSPIPEKCYFFLGDNRGNSQDSRYWGTVSEDLLLGPAVLRYWPPKRIGALGGFWKALIYENQ
jgi:signal peptidase I